MLLTAATGRMWERPRERREKTFLEKARVRREFITLPPTHLIARVRRGVITRIPMTAAIGRLRVRSREKREKACLEKNDTAKAKTGLEKCDSFATYTKKIQLYIVIVKTCRPAVYSSQKEEFFSEMDWFREKCCFVRKVAKILLQCFGNSIFLSFL